MLIYDDQHHYDYYYHDQECFPESFEGYDLELHGGPDEDDESMLVRSKKKGEEEEDERGGKGAKGAKGGKRGVEARESLKKEAKMDRDLVHIERLIDERRKKRQRGDDGAPDTVDD